MKATHLTARDFALQPWKNGGGITTELAVHDEGGRRIWRLSLAQVSRSGPFSDFPGCERTIMLVEGERMQLDFEDRVVRLEPYRPFVFDGSARATGTLVAGAVKDLNLMVDRERARGSIEVIDSSRFTGMRLEADWALAYALRGATRVSIADLECTLEAGQLLRLDDVRGERFDVVALDRAARVALIRIHSS